MKAIELELTQINVWYPIFKDITIYSQFVELSKKFIEYINSDGIRFPKSLEEEEEEVTFVSTPSIEVEETESKQDPVPEFPELFSKIGKIISKFQETGFFIKLNWSSPQDAKFMAYGSTLQSFSIKDIIMLLKSSDFVSHDLNYAVSEIQGRKPKISYYLCIRKWCQIPRASEFRVFVKHGKIVGVSQRHVDQYFSGLQQLKLEHEKRIVMFVEGIVKDKQKNDFLSRLGCYILDMYINPRGQCVLLDINPFAQKTDSLLFSWDELEKASKDTINVDFRLVTSQNGIKSEKHNMYKFPIDLIKLAEKKNEKDIELLLSMLESQSQ